MHIWAYIKITWSHKSAWNGPSHCDGKLAPFYFRPHTMCVPPSVSTVAFCAPYTAPCLGGVGSKDGCTLPNALHSDVRRDLAAQQPTLILFSLSVLEILFSTSAFLPLCFSANSPLLHCLGSCRYAIEGEKGHGALQLARSIGLCVVSC